MLLGNCIVLVTLVHPMFTVNTLLPTVPDLYIGSCLLSQTKSLLEHLEDPPINTPPQGTPSLILGEKTYPALSLLAWHCTISTLAHGIYSVMLPRFNP